MHDKQGDKKIVTTFFTDPIPFASNLRKTFYQFVMEKLSFWNLESVVRNQEQLQEELFSNKCTYSV